MNNGSPFLESCEAKSWVLYIHSPEWGMGSVEWALNLSFTTSFKCLMVSELCGIFGNDLKCVLKLRYARLIFDEIV